MKTATPLPAGNDGFYIGRAVEHSVQTNDETGSCTLSMKIELVRAYDESSKTWEDITEYNHFVYGGFNLLGKGGVLGQTQQKTVNTIQELFRWTDGELETLQNSDISQAYVMVDCKTSVDNNGQNRIRAEWIFVPEEHPTRGGMKKLSEDKLAELSSKHAAKFRAIAKPQTATAPAATPPAFIAGPGQPNDEIGF